ncbi:protein-disulfide reductase DsbD domain-containing protein [Taklimakanibacter lacteus]|uniref:protein-disulfide reductase DsbD domain-containing protein n=1 Tax=Taklimakanibacter lacteus TaxID=2268456 RepID=UPI000E670DE4
MRRRQFIFAALSLPGLSVASWAGAQTRYRARLIGGETQGGVWRAALDIALDKGWKTYWRMPGDAGVPPQFDWSGSRNVRSLTVLWPAPARFNDESGETVGYKDRVVFPLDVTPADGGEPVDLRLNVFLGVCEVICIPVKLEEALLQAAPVPADASLIAAFAARVPEKVDARARFRVARASLVEEADKPALALHLEGQGFDRGLDVFVEGSDFAYFRAPRMAGDAANIHLPIDGLKDPAKLRGKALTLTMVAGDIRLEQDVVVD